MGGTVDGLGSSSASTGCAMDSCGSCKDKCRVWIWETRIAQGFPHMLRPIFSCGASAGHSRCIGGDVVEGERHRHAGVEAHQRDDVGDADVAEGGDGAVEDALRYPA